MAFKPNYNQQRRERDRVKEQKQQEKLQRQQEEVAKRKAAKEGATLPESGEAENI
jgi:hypothetical protein